MSEAPSSCDILYFSFSPGVRKCVTMATVNFHYCSKSSALCVWMCTYVWGAHTQAVCTCVWGTHTQAVCACVWGAHTNAVCTCVWGAHIQAVCTCIWGAHTRAVCMGCTHSGCVCMCMGCTHSGCVYMCMGCTHSGCVSPLKNKETLSPERRWDSLGNFRALGCLDGYIFPFYH